MTSTTAAYHMDPNKLLLFLVCVALASSTCLGLFTDKVFNVVNYGALPDGKTDSAQAFLKAWNEACMTDCGWFGKARVRSRVLIPEGTFFSGPVSFEGPCKSPMVLQVKGVVLAPTTLSAFKAKEWMAFRHVDGLLITGRGKFDGQGDAVWPSKHGRGLPSTLKLIKMSNTKIRGISLVDSKFFHIHIGQSVGIKIYGIRITAPGNSPNTDGIHIGDSTDVRVSQSTIATGDDCISIGSGSSNITMNRIVCGPGHGISVGSLGKYHYDKGVTAIRVLNSTLVGTDNGVRIKTWRDSPLIAATNILFYDIVMKDVRNPIIIDQEYCPGSCDEGKPPSRVKISNVRYENIRGSSATDVAVNFLCSESTPCENIHMKNVNLKPLPPSPGLLPTVPLSTCVHVVNSVAQGLIFPPSCF